MKSKLKREKRFRRHKRVRAKISGTSERPRLCVFKSNKHIYAQLIDDENGRTLTAASDQDCCPPETPTKDRRVESKVPPGSESILQKPKPSRPKKERKSKVAIAFEVGKLIAEKAINLPAGRQGNKIEKVVFDKASYRYQGRVKALAEGAREGGLRF